jgi:hypothetical protein
MPDAHRNPHETRITSLAMLARHQQSDERALERFLMHWQHQAGVGSGAELGGEG